MDTFNHVKTVLGIIFGLGIAQLIKGSVKFIQQPTRDKPYWIHLLWCLYVFLLMVHFWWWEYHLSTVRNWIFPTYFFLIVYTGMFYVLCAFLLPDDVKDYGGDYRQYYYKRKPWFFATLAMVFAADVVDTCIKGRSYYLIHHIEYPIQTVIHVILCLLAMKVANPKFHGILVCLFILYEFAYIFRLFLTE